MKRLNPRHQDELPPGWRHHGVLTNNPMPLLQAEACHRDHALVEQVIADLKDRALAHAPSGKSLPNPAWLVMATMAFNLTDNITHREFLGLDVGDAEDELFWRGFLTLFTQPT